VNGHCTQKEGHSNSEGKLFFTQGAGHSKGIFFYHLRRIVTLFNENDRKIGQTRFSAVGFLFSDRLLVTALFLSWWMFLGLIGHRKNYNSS